MPLNIHSACPNSTCPWKLTRIARNTVEPIPSATSYSPFSLGRVKLCSLPDPNILLKNKSNLVRIPYYVWVLFFLNLKSKVPKIVLKWQGKKSLFSLFCMHAVWFGLCLARILENRKQGSVPQESLGLFFNLNLPISFDQNKS